MRVYKLSRDDAESDTDNTDDDLTWGGFGIFEYGLKGLPHGLVHARELVEVGGHHGAFCTCLAEAEHKCSIKLAAIFSRIYGSLNNTQEGMFDWVLRQRLYEAIIALHDKKNPGKISRRKPVSSSKYLLMTPLHDTDHWSTLTNRIQRNMFWSNWGTTFISPKVLVSRGELLVLLRKKLELTDKTLLYVNSNFSLRCFGSVKVRTDDGIRRKIVGIDNVSTQRRDFVRIQGSHSNTALAAQVRFVDAIYSVYTTGLYTLLFVCIQKIVVCIQTCRCTYTRFVYTPVGTHTNGLYTNYTGCIQT